MNISTESLDLKKNELIEGSRKFLKYNDKKSCIETSSPIIYLFLNMNRPNASYIKLRISLKNKRIIS